MTNTKRIVSIILLFCMIICPLNCCKVYAAKGDLGNGYDVNNIDFTFTTVEGEQVSSDSNGKVKVLVFARTNGNCVNSTEVIKSICGVGWSSTPEIDTLIIDIDQRNKESVKASADSFDPWMIKFCFDESTTSKNLMYQYLELTVGKTSSVTLPVIVLIDKNNKVQYLKNGFISAKELYNYIEPLLNGEINDEEESGVIAPKEQIKVYSQGFYDYDSAEEVFRLTNEARLKEGKSKLIMDDKLTEIAMHRAAEQALLYNHIRPNGTKWYTLLSGKYLSGAGENIAFGQNSAASVTNSWLNSEGHKANIMNSKYTSIGIGSFIHNGCRFWVQIFSSYSEKTYSDKSGVNKNVVVDAIPNNVGEFVIKPYSNNLDVGERTNLIMTLSNLSLSSLKFNVKTDNVKFHSSDNNIATVDTAGNITAVAPGQVTITAILDETLEAKCSLTVKNLITDKPEDDPIADEKLLGDVNEDHAKNAEDALVILNHSANVEAIAEDKLAIADINSDGNVNSQDALLILQFAAGVIQE